MVADVMQELWDHGPSVVNEAKEKLHDELAYTTALTILRTLEQKGYVKHEEEGRVHRYAAAVKENAARKSALQHLTGKLFKGSSELLCKIVNAHTSGNWGHSSFLAKEGQASEACPLLPVPEK